MPGMLAAALLAQKGLRVTLVEAQAALGGLYRSVDYGAGGVFDYGMHMLYDSGIAEVDALLQGALAEGAWHVMEGNRKDIAGIFWNGTLQDYSPYLDLRGLAGGFESVRDAVGGDAPDCEGYFRQRFGEVVAPYLMRVVEKLYGRPAREVSALAAQQPAMDRVLLLEAEAMGAVFADAGLRARIGYPDQLTLPVVRAFAQCARYPRRMGMGQVVEGLEARLRTLGVRICKETKVTALEAQGGRVEAVQLADAAGVRREAVDALFWTAGTMPLQRLLYPGTPADGWEMPMAAHVHLRFREKPAMGELYHFYVFDAGYRTFRVTDYGNYCEGAQNALGWPVCVEYWPEAGQGNEEVLQGALAELRAFGVVGEEGPGFYAVKWAANYHKLFTLAQVEMLAEMRKDIAARGLGNLYNAGVLAQGSELLLYDIARDVYAKATRCAAAV